MKTIEVVFQLFRALGRGFEGRRRIQAIVDHKERLNTRGEGHRHWRIAPENVIVDLVFQEKFIEQERLLHRGRLGLVQSIPQMRRHDKHAAIAPSDVQPLNCRVEDRLLNEEDRRSRADRLIRRCGR